MENEGGLIDPQAAQMGMELAKVQQRPSFLQLVQQISEFEVPSTNVIIESDDDEKRAIELVGQIRDTKKRLNDERLAITTFPRKFVEAVNAMFKGITQMADKQVDRTDKKVRAWRTKKEEEARKAAEEAAKAAAEASILPEGGDVPELPAAPEAPRAYDPVVRADGVKAFDREEWKIEVVDPVKLIRAAMNARNKVPMAVIKVDEAALKVAVKEGEIKLSFWLKYGVSAAKEKKTVYSK